MLSTINIHKCRLPPRTTNCLLPASEALKAPEVQVRLEVTCEMHVRLYEKIKNHHPTKSENIPVQLTIINQDLGFLWNF